MFRLPVRGYDSHMSAHSRWTFAGDPTAAASARTALRSVLEGEPGGLVDDVELLATELITNAVRHGSGDVLLTLEQEGDLLVIAVTAAAAGDPEERVASTEAPSGRGLAIVEALTSEWGWEREGDQVTVWARLTPGAAPSP